MQLTFLVQSCHLELLLMAPKHHIQRAVMSSITSYRPAHQAQLWRHEHIHTESKAALQ